MVAIFVALIAALSAIVVAIINRDHQPDKRATINCSSLRSTDGGQKSNVRFKNSSKLKVSIYWIKQDGSQEHYGDIGPTGTLDIESFVYHCWCVRNAADGKEIQALTLTSEKQEVVTPDSD